MKKFLKTLSIAALGFTAMAATGVIVASNTAELVARAADGDEHEIADFTGKGVGVIVNDKAAPATINIAAPTYGVKKVIIGWKHNKSNDGVTATVKVGNETLGSGKVGGTSTTTTTTIGDGKTILNGAIEISFVNTMTGSGKGTLYINSITLVEGSTEAGLKLDKKVIALSTDAAATTITATPSGFSATSYNWTVKSGSDDCVTLTNTTSATVTVAPKAITGEKTATLVASASDGSKTYTAEATVNVYVKKGTSDNPYTVADAIAAIDRGVASELTNVYTRGIVSKVDSFNSTYGSITYWISDDGVTTNQFEVYSGLGLNNTKFDDINGLKVGDEVVVYGTMKKYNSTYEYDKNNYLTYLGGQTIELTSIDSISGTLSVAEGTASWDLTQLTPMGKINDGATTDISDYVTLTTEDVPGAAGSYTVNVIVTPKDSETVSPKTIGVSGLVVQLDGPVPSGRYYIVDVTRNAALSAAPSTSRIGGTELSESNNAMPFDLALVADNTYEITVTEAGTKYYLLNNNVATSSANDNVRVIEKTSAVSGLKSLAWTVEQFEEQEEGIYTIKQNTTGSTYRYLTCFYQSKEAAECDFRGYITSYADATNQDSRFKLVPEFAWANEIVSGLNAGGLCDGGITAPSKTTWGELSSITYTANELNYLANLNASEGGTLAQQAMARYDFIMRKYNTTAVIDYADFIGRISAGKVTLDVPFESFMDNASSPALAIIIMSMATVAGFGIVVKKVNSKRKED